MQGLSLHGARRVLAACAAVALGFAASGCLRLDLELQVRPDDSVGGSFTAAWSETFLAEARSGEDAIEQSELDAFLDALLDGIPGADRTPYREGGYVGQTAAFTGRPLEEFADIGGDEWGHMRITHQNRRYQLEGHWDLRTAGFLETEAMRDAEVLIRVNFPAAVTSHNGVLDGRTVVWAMVPGEEYDLRAVAEQHNPWAFVGWGLVATAAVLGLVWWWQLTRLRRHSLGENASH